MYPKMVSMPEPVLLDSFDEETFKNEIAEIIDGYKSSRGGVQVSCIPWIYSLANSNNLTVV
jgi:hypothetical protein